MGRDSSRVLSVCRLLKSRDRRRALRLAGRDPDGPTTSLSEGEALLIWTADLLQSAPIERDQAWALCEEFQHDLVRHGEAISRSLAARAAGEKVEVPVLALCDRVLACITGRDGFFDLKAAQFVPGLKSPFLEQIGYNLLELYARQSARLAGLERHACPPD